MTWKFPESVLVVVHTPDLRVLMLERIGRNGWWQSVTGSREPEDATIADIARREVAEETGLQAGDDGVSLPVDLALANRYPIVGPWRHRYAPDVTHNLEHTFAVTVETPRLVRLSPDEHTRYQWVGWREAIERCWSQTNRAAIRHVARRLGAG